MYPVGKSMLRAVPKPLFVVALCCKRVFETDSSSSTPGKHMFVGYSWNIPMIYSRDIREKVPVKFWGILTTNVPGILNIRIFPEYAMNILEMLDAFFR